MVYYGQKEYTVRFDSFFLNQETFNLAIRRIVIFPFSGVELPIPVKRIFSSHENKDKFNIITVASNTVIYVGTYEL